MRLQAINHSGFRYSTYCQAPCVAQAVSTRVRLAVTIIAPPRPPRLSMVAGYAYGAREYPSLLYEH